MKEMILLNNLVSEKTGQEESVLCRSRQKWTKALILSAVIGILIGSAGLIINGLSLFGLLENNHRLSRLGIWMIVLTFPVGALTAHCLDRLEAIKKAVKIEYYGARENRDERR